MSLTMTDCSSTQGSSASSSSDVVTLTTASSWCAIPPGARIRVVRLIRPHTRRILVTPDANPSYGFAVRGGKEFGTGFFVSVVERNSEAELKGLRVGDQILRINGFRVDDAVHREFIQFVQSQDRLTMKVRGVGMLPIKDKENDRLSWNVVKTLSVSNTPSESSFNTLPEREKRNGKDINIVLNVAPRTKLGLGICKGPEWKPGIFVQFTKEKSIAREAGLRPGDQILSVNSIDFSDVLFSEAVAVMKGSNKLDMMIRTGAGCDLFPGESSGYNSSASSVTGDQSPCWADPKSKRLTAVCEEPLTANWNEAIYANNTKARSLLKKDNEKSAQVLKENNKTIIKLSENDAQTHRNDCQMLRSNPSHSYLLRSTSNTTAGTPLPPPAPPKLPIFELNHNNSNDNNENHNTNNNNNHNNHNDSSATKGAGFIGGSSLSSAISEELKKRKEKLKQQQQQQHATNNSHNNNHNKTSHSNQPTSEQQQHHHHNHHHQHHSLQKQINSSASSSSSTPSQLMSSSSFSAVAAVGGSSANSSFTNTIMRRQQLLKTRSNSISRTNSSATNCNNERNSLSSSMATTAVTPITPPATANATLTNNHHNHHNSNTTTTPPTTTNGIVVDQHSALMDEFKKAHQRMFRNGFREMETKAHERQDALKRTSIMEDEVCHRSTKNISDITKKFNEQLANGNKSEETNSDLPIPPPPPQFANSPPKPPQNNSTPTPTPANSTQPLQKTPLKTKQVSIQKPPASPAPDYEPVPMRTNLPGPPQGPVGGNQRQTLRLGTVTIGEYDGQGRKEPNKFDFLAKQQISHNKNLSKSQSNLSNGHSNGQSLQAELQHTLKRSNLKTNGVGVGAGMGVSIAEHQSHCPLQDNYEHFDYRRSNNMGNLSQKMQNLNMTSGKTGPLKNGFHNNSSQPLSNGSSAPVSTGILKNSGRNSNGYQKSHEKTISFGN